MKANILFVDDEKAILKSIQRTFFDSEYNLFIAESGRDALAIMERENIDVIISDMRMPNMTGYQLLKIVKAQYPEIIRIILSGYTHEKEILKAIMDGSCKMYFLKPWNDEVLMKTIEQLLQIRKLLKNKKIFDVINNIKDLNTLPDIYNKIVSMIEQDYSLKDISEEVKMDSVISSKVLHIANSIFYNTKIGSVEQAIVFLGANALKTIILSTSVLDAVSLDLRKKYIQKILWQHACLSNRLTIAIYETLLGKKIPEIVSTAGLLHNLGQVIMLNQCNFKDDLPTDNREFCIKVFWAELASQDIFSPEVGGYLLNWWNLPQPIIEAALFYQNPLTKMVINKDVVGVVHIASHFAWKLLNCQPEYSLFPEVFDFLKITPDVWKKFRHDCYKSFSSEFKAWHLVEESEERRMKFKYTVLFVDDEPNILNSIRRTVMEEDFKALFAGSGQEALDILRKEEVCVLVTDMRMPGMDGLALLKQVKQYNPDIVRIVLSGYTQLSQILATINYGDIFKFIVKPWQEEDLNTAVRQAIEYYKFVKDGAALKKTLEQRNIVYKNVLKNVEKRISTSKHDFTAIKKLDQWIFQFFKRKIEGECNGQDKCDIQLFEKKFELVSELHAGFIETLPSTTAEFTLEQLNKKLNEYMEKTGVDGGVNLIRQGLEVVKYVGNYNLLFLVLSLYLRQLLAVCKQNIIECRVESNNEGEKVKLIFSLKLSASEILEEKKNQTNNFAELLQTISLAINEMSTFYDIYTVLHSNNDEILLIIQADFNSSKAN